MVTNITNGNEISEKVYEARNILDKTFGMILEKNSEGLIFKTRFGIHTFFMKKPIDVLILDNNNIVKVFKKLKPNRILVWNPKFDTVIELPDGLVEKTRTKVGDRLKF